MTSEKLKPTPGPWLFGDWVNDKRGIEDEAGWVDVWVRLPDGTRSVPIVSCRSQQQIGNARLIAEAGTVFHECGLSPRELQERCSAMETALQHCEQMLMKYAIDRVDHEAIEDEALEIIRAALDKHKEV